jgi:dTDP-4-dehydrorhamnose reductase
MDKKKVVLIIGGNGLLGHKLHYYLNKSSVLGPVTTVRSAEWATQLGRFGKVIPNLDVNNLDKIRDLIETAKYVINAVALIPQRGAFSRSDYIRINGLFPHTLASICNEAAARLIHISTDGVFDGKKGEYSDSDVPNAKNDYGYSKAMGEIGYGPNLTLRTSIIGTELASSNCLLEWLRNEEAQTVCGYTESIWSGLTSDFLAKSISYIIENEIDANGIYNIGIHKGISKYELLSHINEILDLGKQIIPDDSVVINRSLDSSRFERDFEIDIPSIAEQLRNQIDLSREIEPFE